VREGGTWVYRDLGSRRGSHVGGARVERCPIKQPTTLILGTIGQGPSLTITPLDASPSHAVPPTPPAAVDHTVLATDDGDRRGDWQPGAQADDPPEEHAAATATAPRPPDQTPGAPAPVAPKTEFAKAPVRFNRHSISQSSVAPAIDHQAEAADQAARLADAVVALAALLERTGIEVVEREEASIQASARVPSPVNWAIGGSLLLLFIVPGLIYLFVTRKPSKVPLIAQVDVSGAAPTVTFTCSNAGVITRLDSLVRSELHWNPVSMT
jgi:hypothetical protein